MFWALKSIVFSDLFWSEGKNGFPARKDMWFRPQGAGTKTNEWRFLFPLKQTCINVDISTKKRSAALPPRKVRGRFAEGVFSGGSSRKRPC